MQNSAARMECGICKTFPTRIVSASKRYGSNLLIKSGNTGGFVLGATFRIGKSGTVSNFEERGPPGLWIRIDSTEHMATKGPTKDLDASCILANHIAVAIAARESGFVFGG